MRDSDIATRKILENQVSGNTRNDLTTMSKNELASNNPGQNGVIPYFTLFVCVCLHFGLSDEHIYNI